MYAPTYRLKRHHATDVKIRLYLLIGRVTALPGKAQVEKGIFAVRNLKNLKYQCAQLISLNLSVKDDKRDACETENIKNLGGDSLLTPII
jgi:hypothetical protein